jgi:predicted HTH domain antitoxin
MDTLTVDEVTAEPRRLVADAVRGEPALVTQDGVPVMMTVPLGAGLESEHVRLELAVRLYDREQISVGAASQIAGLTIAQMLSELGKRNISIARYSEEEFKDELRNVATLTGRR